MNEKQELPGFSAALVFLTAICGVLVSSSSMAMAPIVSLPELVRDSQLVVYGNFSLLDKQPASSSYREVQVVSAQALKGGAWIRRGTIKLCNYRPNSEWPELTDLAGEKVLFLSRKRGCFRLSHNYRSVVPVRSSQAHTVTIEDQPEDQELVEFIEKVRVLVSKAPSHSP